MSIKLNGYEILDINFNNTPINIVNLDSTQVWARKRKKEKWKFINQLSTYSNYVGTNNDPNNHIIFGGNGKLYVAFYAPSGSLRTASYRIIDITDNLNPIKLPADTAYADKGAVTVLPSGKLLSFPIGTSNAQSTARIFDGSMWKDLTPYSGSGEDLSYNKTIVSSKGSRYVLNLARNSSGQSFSGFYILRETLQSPFFTLEGFNNPQGIRIQDKYNSNLKGDMVSDINGDVYIIVGSAGTGTNARYMYLYKWTYETSSLSLIGFRDSTSVQNKLNILKFENDIYITINDNISPYNRIYKLNKDIQFSPTNPTNNLEDIGINQGNASDIITAGRALDNIGYLNYVNTTNIRDTSVKAFTLEDGSLNDFNLDQIKWQFADNHQAHMEYINNKMYFSLFYDSYATGFNLYELS